MNITDKYKAFIMKEYYISKDIYERKDEVSNKGLELRNKIFTGLKIAKAIPDEKLQTI